MTKRYDKPLTIEELASMPDENIDTSDIPELDDSFWDNAVLTPPRIEKQPISLRVDKDIYDFFKKGGTGHLTRMHAVLRSYVDAHKNHDR